MQRGVGQHDAQGSRVRGQQGGEGVRRRAPAQGAEDNGLFRREQQGFMGRGKIAEAARRLLIRQHDGQRLVRAGLAFPQAGHGGILPGIAGQLKAAQPLEGQNVAVPQQIGGLPQGRAGGPGRHAGGRGAVLRMRDQPEPGAALGAGHGLGMEAAVEGIAVFGGAARAEGKAGHAGGGPVIGDGAGDGVARPAIGAIGEGVAEARIARIAHVPQAVGADAHIRADEHAVPAAARALHNLERRAGQGGIRRQIRALQPGEAGQGRQFFRQTPQKTLHGGGLALQLEADPVGGVAHLPGQTLLHGQPVDKGAKAHALNLSAHEAAAANVGCVLHRSFPEKRAAAPSFPAGAVLTEGVVPGGRRGQDVDFQPVHAAFVPDRARAGSLGDVAHGNRAGIVPGQMKADVACGIAGQDVRFPAFRPLRPAHLHAGKGRSAGQGRLCRLQPHGLAAAGHGGQTGPGLPPVGRGRGVSLGRTGERIPGFRLDRP